MSYSGYNYSQPYQSGRNQPSNNHSARQPNPDTVSGSASTWHTSDRSYSQPDYSWQGQTPSNTHTSNGQHSGSFWPSNGVSASQNQNYAQSTYRTSQLSQSTTLPVSTTYSSAGLTSSSASARASTSVATNHYYQQSQTQGRTPSPNVPVPYQSTSLSLNPTDRPNSAQRSRNAAASAMTALSSSIPNRRFSQSTSGGSSSVYSSHNHTYIPTVPPTSTTSDSNQSDYSTGLAPVSRQISSSQPAAVHIGQAKDTWASVNTSRAQYPNNSSQSSSSLISRFLNSQGRTSQAPVATSAPGYPSLHAATYSEKTYQNVTGTNHSDADTMSSNNNRSQYASAGSHSQDATAQTGNIHEQRQNPQQSPPSSLPTFIDPSKIYDPYHDYERARATYHTQQQQQQETEEPAQPDTAVEQALVAALTGNRVEDIANAGEQSEHREEPANPSPAPAPASVRRKPGPKPGSKPGQKRQQKREPAVNPNAALNDNRTEPSLRTDSEVPQHVGETTQPAPTPRKPGPKAGQKRKKPPRSSITASSQKGESHEVAQPSPEVVQGQDHVTENDTVNAEGASVEESMASEMRLMIERMREWRSKDPSLFAKLWEGVKKAPAANSGNAASSQSVPVTPAAKPATPATPSNPAKPTSTARSATRTKPLKPAPPELSGSNAANGVEATITVPEALPDLGKFPAARRKKKSRLSNVDTIEGQGDQHLSSPGQTVSSTQPSAQSSAAASKESQPPSLGKSQTGQSTQNKAAKPSNVWPLAKRQALADAACSYILQVRQNSEKECSSSMILELIDQDPSYSELCGMIEAKGYSINRVHLAKHLLKAVPDVASSQARAPAVAATVQPQDSGATGTPQPVTPMPPVPASGPSEPLESFAPPSISTPDAFTTPTPVVHSFAKIPIPPNPAGGSLRWKARNQIMINNRPVEPPQTSTVPPLPVPSTQAGFNAPAAFSSFPPLPPLPSFKTFVPVAPTNIDNMTSNGFRAGSKAPVSHLPKGPPLGPKEAQAKKRKFSDIVDMAQALSSDEEDVDEIEPVHKLPCLDESQSQPAAMEHDSTPAPAATTPVTAASPAVDPAQHAMQEEAKREARNELRRRTDISKPINKAEALRRTYYDPKTIARDILIASGRHPTEQPLNYHLLRLREQFMGVDWGSDLRTFRWDLVDPGSPPPDVPFAPLPSRPPLPTRHSRSGDLSSDSAFGLTPSRDQADATSAESDANTNLAQASKAHFPIFRTPDLRRKPSLFTPVNSNSTMAGVTPIRRGRGRPPGAKNRPKPAQPSAPLEVVVQARLPSPQYMEFTCRWKGCDARLHNLETLKKHVTRLHVPSEDQFDSCRWSNCSRDPQNLLSSEELHGHIEKAHLQPLAWTHGEGPATKGSGENGDAVANPIVIV